MLHLRDEQWLAVSCDGHFKGSEGISDKLIYVVQTDDGVQHTSTPAKFAERSGCKNNPDKVKLVDSVSIEPKTHPPQRAQGFAEGRLLVLIS